MRAESVTRDKGLSADKAAGERAAAAQLATVPRRSLGLKAWQWGALAAVFGIAGWLGYTAYHKTLAPEPVTPKGLIATATRGSVVATVNTTGSLVAGTTAKVGFNSSGRVTEVLLQAVVPCRRGW